jgi:anti-sigma factor RsiW
MLTCDEAARLILDAVDEAIDPESRARLDGHLKGCPTCRADLGTQLLVRRVLAERPADALPEGFSERLAGRLDGTPSATWHQQANWRTWSIRLLPIAAALLVAAGLVERAHTNAHSIENTFSELLARPDFSEESRLLDALTDAPQPAAEDPRR